MDPPPSDNFEEARLLYSMQQVRTSTQVEAIQQQNENPVPLFWLCAGLNERDFPTWSAYVNEAVLDTESVLLYFKKLFNRPRPTAVLPAIQPPVPVPWHAAYPSGHATQAVVIASLLAKLSPKAGRDLMNFALEVGRNREVAGLHYPSDTGMGIKLGKQLAEIFLPLSPS
jgi:acid phosphatase (class A)